MREFFKHEIQGKTLGLDKTVLYGGVVAKVRWPLGGSLMYIVKSPAPIIEIQLFRATNIVFRIKETMLYQI